jgi:hypothetical protein
MLLVLGLSSIVIATIFITLIGVNLRDTKNLDQPLMRLRVHSRGQLILQTLESFGRHEVLTIPICNLGPSQKNHHPRLRE